MENTIPKLTHPSLRQVQPADTLTPADRYQELFTAVQMSCVFDDGKTFVDCAPKINPDEILELYRSRHAESGFDLKAFVESYFVREESPETLFVADTNKNIVAHIESIWPLLTRYPKEHPLRSSILPLPYDYLVPGGRFKELYYWDSYFTMLGLVEETQVNLLRSMTNNFAYLIDTYGHIPNGNRTYYLSRSQPPVFSLMVDLIAKKGVATASDYLPQLRKEYAYWMAGSEELRSGEAHSRSVCMSDGSILNRYWDDRDTPREESYREDVCTARESNRPVHQVYRDLRAGAESGWDFSSRWQTNPSELGTICTTSIVPIDLNSLLFNLEKMIQQLAIEKSDDNLAEDFANRSKSRQKAIDKYLWNDERGTYFDYHWRDNYQRSNLTAASMTPLFVKLANVAQAKSASEVCEKFLLTSGGIATTTEEKTGQQWDQPNGWAPLQWIAVQGLRNYGFNGLADTIRERWLDTITVLYNREHKLVEKYVLTAGHKHAKGGEYPLQDGFGWTNGIARYLLNETLDKSSH
jgi:alpha,alpha-trehalase